ncbi:HEAT repeat domain-containing protein [Actinoplanes subglobosus]|uniref:HEAT repeat domain-containing protein n=1 Tax=Actinoplanes subglobosus TaxID=1547892 RepID=A0ABV8IZ79_9ACTN
MTGRLDHVFRLAADDDPWPLVRELAGSGDLSLVPPVQAALERCLDDHDWYGRDLMAYLLVGLRGVAAFPLVLRAFARPLEGGDHRRLIGELVVELMRKDPGACRPVIVAFAGSAHPGLRSAAVWALGYVLEPADLDLLRAAAADPDRAVRQAAVGSLAELKDDRRAFELVVAALADPDDPVRLAAVTGLRWFGSEDAVPHLARLAHDPSPAVRSVLGDALGALLISPGIAGDLDPAPGALGLLSGAPGASFGIEDTLAVLLGDPEPSVRAAAARGVQRLEVLRAHLGDPDPRVRAAVAAGLARHGGPELAVLAADESPLVRADLVTALGVSGHPGARPLVEALADDPDRAVRARVRVALDRLG